MVISPILFALSLGFSGYYCEGESPDWSFGSDSGSGLLLLMIGWFGLFNLEFAWLANPIYLLTLTISFPGFFTLGKADQSQNNRYRATRADLAVALAISLLATALAISFLLQSTTIGGSGPAGTSFRIIGYNPGYFLWVTSMVIQSLGLATCLFSKTLSNPQEGTPKP